MKCMKYICLLIVTLTSLCSTAQVYSSEACFYLVAGENPDSPHDVWVAVSFRGNKAVLRYYGSPLWRIQKDLKENKNYYEEVDIQDGGNGWIYTYDSSMSTNSRYVYKRCVAGKSPAHAFDVSWSAYCDYLAFSKDNSSLIRWREQDDRIFKKKQLVRVKKSEVLPQGVKRDFLE